ncbi:MAG: biotin--[acetyl-CoA-carboxylase] ligase [Acidobacteria bacterium]|nr:biotin--[acetyl-CoA-carboxylase] ligase [Acidobacteriota bacterium]
MKSPLGSFAPIRGLRYGRLANVVLLTSVSSTNSLGRRVAERMIADDTDLPPTAFVTWNQTAGRGRAGRSWARIPGSLAVSTLIPWPEPEERVKLPLGFGIALARALSARFGVELRLKWPNDLVFDHQKLGGILVEASTVAEGSGYAIIGTGINVLTSRTDLDGAGFTEATSLACVAPGVSSLDGEEALLRVLGCVDEALGTFPADLPLAFETVSAHQPGDRIRVHEADRIVEGEFRGVTPLGFLRIETASGEEEILSGDVLSY